MLTLYRRHREKCKHRSRRYKGCSCPIWAQGTVRGESVRQSLNLTNWEAASRLINEWEIKGSSDRVMALKEATKRFIEDCEARKLKPLTVKKYRCIKRVLDAEFENIPVSSISVDDLRKFREGWKLSGNAARKRIEHIRGFFAFCLDAGWIDTNPMKSIKPPKFEHSPTLPFTADEWDKILWAVDAYREIHPGTSEMMQKKLKALVLLMRYSGLRISDAVALGSERIDDRGRLHIRQEKTGHPVMVPLPPFVVQALKDADDGYYFWERLGKLTTCLTKWHERMSRMFAISGVHDAHSHRFRDSFAVDLLSKGVDIKTVSVLLGHTSIKTTEVYYAPWIKSRQDALDAAVMAVWS